jgi:hypothetical protein
MTGYANAGIDPMNSSDAQARLTDINQSYDQAIAEYQQQIQNKAMEQAISFKKDMLSSAMQQGQFDYESAMELATYIGRDKEMQWALENKNYEALQGVLGEIFTLGLGQAKTT